MIERNRTMEILNPDDIQEAEAEPARICPYLEIKCSEFCPGWIEEVDDCLFHVCLTQVRDTFALAATALDRHLGLEAGVASKTMSGLRQVVNGEASPEQKRIVGSVLGSLIQGGIIEKVSSMTVPQLAKLIGKVEGALTFSLRSLFGSVQDDPEGPGSNGC